MHPRNLNGRRSLLILNFSQSFDFNELLKLWKFLSGTCFGRWVFSRIIGWVAPYTGTIGAVILKLEPGSVTVTMKDRFKVRNHLGSVHAIALMNLAEFSSGLATLSSAPKNVKGILTHLEIDYLKKARGPLCSNCHISDDLFKPIPNSSDLQAIVPVQILNTQNEVVATAQAHWRFRPKGL